MDHRRERIRNRKGAQFRRFHTELPENSGRCARWRSSHRQQVHLEDRQGFHRNDDRDGRQSRRAKDGVIQ